MRHKQASAFAAAAAIASIAATACAGFSIGGFYGEMDTEMLGKGTIYGAQVEAGVSPVSIIVRGAYADDFDGLDEGSPIYNDMFGFATLTGLSEQYKIEDIKLDKQAVVPVEVGLMLRLPHGIVPFFSIYGGGGAGYYYIPGVDIICEQYKIGEVGPANELFGYWFCAGVEIDFKYLHLFAEAKYLDVDDEVEAGWGGRTLEYDVDLSGWTWLVGARIGL